MTVDLACDGTDAIFEIFVRCLTVLPNLHALEVISMGSHFSDPLRDALDGVELPQIKILILPSMAHCLLRHCPNVDDLTCTPFRPNEDFIRSLIAGRQKLRRFAVLFPGNVVAWTGERFSWFFRCTVQRTIPHTGLARVFPDISEFSVVYVSPPCNRRPIDADWARRQWDNVSGDTQNRIASLKKPSTLQIIYLVPHHDTVPVCNLRFGLEFFQEQARYRSAYRETMEKRSENRWSEMKQLAIEHLRSCFSSDPKVLRTIVLDHDRTSGMHFHSVARMEETYV